MCMDYFWRIRISFSVTGAYLKSSQGHIHQIFTSGEAITVLKIYAPGKCTCSECFGKCQINCFINRLPSVRMAGLSSFC